MRKACSLVVGTAAFFACVPVLSFTGTVFDSAWPSAAGADPKVTVDLFLESV